MDAANGYFSLLILSLGAFAFLSGIWTWVLGETSRAEVVGVRGRLSALALVFGPSLAPIGLYVCTAAAISENVLPGSISGYLWFINHRTLDKILLVAIGVHGLVAFVPVIIFARFAAQQVRRTAATRPRPPSWIRRHLTSLWASLSSRLAAWWKKPPSAPAAPASPPSSAPQP